MAGVSATAWLEAAAPSAVEPGASARDAADANSRRFGIPLHPIDPLTLLRVRRAAEVTDQTALFARLQHGGLIDERVDLELLRGGETGHLRPITSSKVPIPLRARLATSYQVALGWVKGRPTCQELFEQLQANGQVALATTIYLASDGEHQAQLCDRAKAAAYTWLGQPATYLCPSFASLSNQEAALALIHEALHYSGLPERPVHRGAMSSREISNLVRDRCGP